MTAYKTRDGGYYPVRPQSFHPPIMPAPIVSFCDSDRCLPSRLDILLFDLIRPLPRRNPPLLNPISCQDPIPSQTTSSTHKIAGDTAVAEHARDIISQYFSVPHLFQLDSSGFQWIPLYSTGIYLCVDFFIFINYILGTFQVIPGCSRSFQVIPVDSHTV